MSELETQIAEIDNDLDFLLDEGNIEEELIQLNKPTFNQLREVQLKDDKIVKELEELKNLWVVANFIKEIEINIEMYELESVALSLDKLKFKIDTLNDLNVKPLALENLYKLRDQFDEVLNQLWNKLLVFENDEIIFNGEIEIDGAIIEYQTFIDLINQYNFNNININTSQQLDRLLIDKLVTNDHIFKLIDNKIQIIESSTTPSLNTTIESIVSIINFISQFPESSKIIHYITTRLYEWLKLIIITNVEIIYNDQSVKDEFLNLNEFLKNHGVKRDDLKQWLTYELNEFIVEYYQGVHVKQLRDVFENNSNFKDLIKRNIAGQVQQQQPQQLATTQKLEKTNVKTETSKRISGNDDDDWGAWGDNDIEFDDDEEKTTEEPIIEDSNQKEDDWDAWDDEDEEKPIIKTKLVSKLSKNSSRTPTPTAEQTSNKQNNNEKINIKDEYYTSKIPDLIIPILKSYISQTEKLINNNKNSHNNGSLKSIHDSKLIELITTYYLLSLNSYNTNKFLLYNDLQFVASSFQSVTLIHLELIKLSEQLLTESVTSIESQIFKTFKSLQNLNPSLSSHATITIISEIDSEFLEFKDQVNILKYELKEMILIAALDSVFQLIIDSIMSRLSIGEDESEYLVVVIGKFLSLQIIQSLATLENDVDIPVGSNIPNFSKLIHIQFILKSHLADILDSFYNAEFYDLSTGELIGLIDRLFADSDLKRRYIAEIKEIRETD